MKIRNLKHLIIFLILLILPFTAIAANSFISMQENKELVNQKIDELALQPEIVFPTPEIIVTPTPIPEPVGPIEEELRWAQKSEEYPIATYIWQTLKSWGWNDYVCAGIMGNLMRETAGDTLNIKPTLYDSTGKYYGICQWSARYCPDVQGKDLDTQLEYLKNTVEKEFNTFGKLYYSGFTYWHFTQLNNERDAALAFAKCYERCSSAGYTKRQNNATRAYEYFVG